MFVFYHLTFMVSLAFLLLNSVSKTSSLHACNSALGLEDGRIKDSKLSASSYYSRMYIYSGSIFLDTLARFGRLKHKYAWCGRDSAPYFQIDFGEMVVVTGLATQGFRANWNNNYVKTYTLKYSVNGSAWNDYSSPNRRWTGNKDGNTIKKNTLKSLHTRYLRIYPLTYSSRRCLRVEVYGCRLSEKATTQSPTQAITPTTSLSSAAEVIATTTVPMGTAMATTTSLPTSKSVAKSSTVVTTQSRSISPTVNPESQACNSALGLEDGRIKDSQLSASSYVDNEGRDVSYNTEAKYGRLRNKFAWCVHRPSEAQSAQYFQVDFGGIVNVTALATQGMNDYYVNIYTLKYSFDGDEWSHYSSPNKEWIGNNDGNKIRKNTLKSFQTRYLRIYPLEWSTVGCLRVEVYGCRLGEKAKTRSPAQAIAPTISLPSAAKVIATATVPMATVMVTTTTLPTSAKLVAKSSTVTTTQSSSIPPTVNPSNQACNSALGLEDGRIKDSQLSASSYYSNMYIYSGSIYLDTLARFGRLKNKYAWCGRGLAPYFQIDFGEMVDVTGLATQGFRANWNNNYVTTYTLKYSINGRFWFDYSSPNKQWTGNKDGNTIKKNTLKPFRTRYLRIYPQTYSSRRCLRVEVYGCRLSEKATTRSPAQAIALTTSLPSAAKVIATATVPMATVMVTTKTLPTSPKLVAK